MTIFLYWLGDNVLCKTASTNGGVLPAVFPLSCLFTYLRAPRLKYCEA